MNDASDLRVQPGTWPPALIGAAVVVGCILLCLVGTLGAQRPARQPLVSAGRDRMRIRAADSIRIHVRALGFMIGILCRPWRHPSA